MSATPEQYQSFQTAYEHFNSTLFSGQLPNVLITLQRKSKAYGYFCAKRFSSRPLDEALAILMGTKPVETLDELAMNPDGFSNREDKAILSTLVHEMTHVWQEHFGKAPKRCYHNKQWAAKMKQVGLYPSTTAAPGGKETGVSCSHYIIDGGVYESSYKILADGGFKLAWQSAPPLPADAKPKSKVKYSCDGCTLNVWAKPGVNVLCGACKKRLASEDEDGAEEKKAA